MWSVSSRSLRFELFFFLMKSLEISMQRHLYLFQPQHYSFGLVILIAQEAALILFEATMLDLQQPEGNGLIGCVVK